ncbi:MAG: alpha/beta fold hydrolase [Mycoplasmatales bacterium]
MKKNWMNINNTNLNYIDVGKGEPIIFLHGWGQDLECFLPSIEYLQENYRCIALDMPGFGDSDLPPQNTNMEAYKDIVLGFINELNLIKPNIVVHSFGNRILGLMYEQYEFNNIVITGGAGLITEKDFSVKCKIYYYKLLKFLTKTPIYYMHKDDLASAYGSSDFKNANPILREILVEAVNLDLEEYYKLISNKTLLYWGELDDATPLSEGKRLNDLIKHSRLIIKKDKSHFAFLETNEDFNTKLKKFIEVR